MPVPIQPVPTEISVGQAQGPQGVMVTLTISSPSGTQAFFLPPVAAKQVGEHLQKAGEAGNLIIAQPGADLGQLKSRTSEPPGPNRAERRAAERDARRDVLKMAS